MSADADNGLYTLRATEYDHGEYTNLYVCSRVKAAKEIAVFIASGSGYNAEEPLDWTYRNGKHCAINRAKTWRFEIYPTPVFRSKKDFAKREDGLDDAE